MDGIEVPYQRRKTGDHAAPISRKVSPVFFVRCQLFDNKGKPLVDNVYWQSQKDDDVGGPQNDYAMDLRQDRWADMTALNTMPKVDSR